MNPSLTTSAGIEDHTEGQANLFFKPELSLLLFCVHFPPHHWVTHSLTLLHGFLLTWPFVHSAIIHFLSITYWSSSKKQGIQNSCSNILVDFPTRKQPYKVMWYVSLLFEVALPCSISATKIQNISQNQPHMETIRKALPHNTFYNY